MKLEMMDVESAYSEFISCDRTGRRNAVPDIKDKDETSQVGELSENMGELAIQGAGMSPSRVPHKGRGQYDIERPDCR
eukprot:XP_017944803.1 PREDICTED: cAMP-dependent protein kinase inhibitor gamma isoform X2 [Xenopus tropicalis]